MADKFPTAYHEANDYLTCPNGDKARSDEEGLFCWIDSERIPAVSFNGQIVLQPVIAPVVVVEVPVDPASTKTATPTKSKAKVEADANG
jgi:hypothetical protein